MAPEQRPFDEEEIAGIEKDLQRQREATEEEIEEGISKVRPEADEAEKDA
jgi:hypothetical protein